MNGRLVLAVPSKGRLQENVHAFFARAGLPILQGRGARDYRGCIAGLDEVEVWFLSASEIATQLAAGAVHLGVTGEDLVREQVPNAEQRVAFVAPLGFGYANVVVAVPQAWIDVRTMQDLDDVAAQLRARRGRRLRVATKYVNLTRGFFARCGVGDYRIVESLGATEGAPASGAADAIVDITTTGATLAANALKVLDDGTVLRSEANLIASLTAPWSAAERSAAAEMLSRIAAEERARRMREVRLRAEDPRRLLDLAAERFGAGVPFGQDGTTAVLHCPEERLFELVRFLRDFGATTITAARLDYVFEAENPLLTSLLARLEKASSEHA